MKKLQEQLQEQQAWQLQEQAWEKQAWGRLQQELLGRIPEQLPAEQLPESWERYIQAQYSVFKTTTTNDPIDPDPIDPMVFSELTDMVVSLKSKIDKLLKLKGR